MSSIVRFIRTIGLVLLCLAVTGCADAWINKSGSLRASVSNVKPSELHDVYVLMRRQGFQMTEVRGSGIANREIWEVLAWGKAGSFVDPNDQGVIVSFIYTEADRRLIVSMNEFYVKGGGFKPESQQKADQVMSALKRRFGKSLKVTVRSYYSGIH